MTKKDKILKYLKGTLLFDDVQVTHCFYYGRFMYINLCVHDYHPTFTIIKKRIEHLSATYFSCRIKSENIVIRQIESVYVFYKIKK